MRNVELNPKIAWGAIVVVTLIVALLYYFFFRPPSGELSAKQAGLGKAVRPGEIPPGMAPPPWANKSLPPQLQPPTAPPNNR